MGRSDQQFSGQALLAAPCRTPSASRPCTPPSSPHSHSRRPTRRPTGLAATGGLLVFPPAAAAAATARAAGASPGACARRGGTGLAIRLDLQRYATHRPQGPAGHRASVVKGLRVEDRAPLGWWLAALPKPIPPPLRALERRKAAFLHVPTSIRRPSLSLLRIEVLAFVLAVRELRR